MNIGMKGEGGRRWFGAAVVLVSVMALVAALLPNGVAALHDGQTDLGPSFDYADYNEPNNTKGTATPIIPSGYWEQGRGTIDPPGDQDFFAFEGSAGDRATIELYFPQAKLDLYGGAGCATYLAGGEDSGGLVSIELELPFDGRYCIRVRSADHPNAGGSDVQYELVVGLIDRFEPNDSPDQSTPISYGQTVYATMIPIHNADYFTFAGKAGDHVMAQVHTVLGYGPILSIIGPNGVLQEQFSWEDVSVQVTLPGDGTYYVFVDYDAFEGFVTDGPYSLTLDKGIMVSPVTGGKTGNLVFDNDDVLLHFEVADRWTRLFDPDASTIDTDISAFTVFQEYRHTWLMALKYPRTLCIDPTWYEPCAGGWQSIQPHDVLMNRYNLQWLFDGSDVGLSTAGEKIDALAIAPDGRLLLSTVASGSVPGVSSFRDEDVLAFTPTQWGSDTAGTWELYFDGSTIPGLAVEDVTGIDVGIDSILYLSMLDGFAVGGVRCGPTCIIAVHPDGHVEKAWDGREVGFGYKLDAFDFAGSAALMQP